MKKKDAFSELAEKHEAKAPEKKEGKDAWDEYVESFAHQQKLDRSLGQDIKERTPDLALLGAQGATFGHLDELQGVGSHLAGGDYHAARDKAREKIAGARDRQGALGDLAEAGGSAVTSIAVPALRGGTFIKELGLAALQGLGESDELENAPAQMAKSMAVSAGTQGVVKGTAHALFGKPSNILANTSGARGINFRDAKGMASKHPDEIAKRLDKIGFFKMGDRVFDPSTKTFILNSYPSGKLEGYLKPQSLDTFHDRAEKAIMMLGDQNARLLKGKKIPISEVDDVLIDTAYDFIPEGTDVTARAKAAADLTQEIVNDLRSRGAIKGKYIDASEVQKAKQYLQQKVHKTYKAQALSDITNDGVEARRQYATKLDELLDKYGGKEYTANNDLMHDFFQQKDMIHNKNSRMSGESISGPKLTRPSLTDRAVDLVDTPMVGVGRARVGQALETSAGRMSVDSLNRIPTEVINNHQGRRPQSTDFNIPEQLIRTPLPRTTDGLIKNKSFVLAKIAQMAPDMLEAVQDTYDHEPEMLSELAPVIAQKMPQFFARDKYDRFDGRVMTEAGKNKAIKDTLGDTRLSTIEQAKIITRLNKEGMYDR